MSLFNKNKDNSINIHVQPDVPRVGKKNYGVQPKNGIETLDMKSIRVKKQKPNAKLSKVLISFWKGQIFFVEGISEHRLLYIFYS